MAMEEMSHDVRKVTKAQAAAIDGPPTSILTIPLVPHHVQHRRRLMEVVSPPLEAAVSFSGSSSSSSNYLSSAADRERPRRYPRRRLATSAPTAKGGGEEQPSRMQREQQQQQQQQHENHNQQVVSLFQGFGTHYADLWCGSPVPQRQTVIVDTGSASTAFACSGCSPRRCGRLDRYHTDPPFQESKSSSFRKLPCTECFLGDCALESNECSFGVSYQEGSNWTAFEAVDTCYVGGIHTKQQASAATTTAHAAAAANVAVDGLDPHRAASDFAFDLRFGCQTQMSGNFRTQLADGIMGMDIGKPAIWNQMFLQNKIAARAFSLCFSRQSDARRSGTEAGAMTFGGTDERLHLASNHSMVFSATNLDGAGFFSVQLHKMYLRQGGGGDSVLSSDPNAKVVPITIAENLMNHGQVIIDSGTTDTYFVHHLSEPFKQVWHDLLGTPYTNDPISLTDEELNGLPTIILQFKGDVSNQKIAETSGKAVPLAKELDPGNPLDVLVAVPPSHYMEYQEDKGMYVPGVYFDEPDGSVLGANIMMLHDIFFDVEHYRIGWVESHCDYTQLVAPFLETKTTTTTTTTTTVADAAAAAAALGEPYQAPNVRVRPIDTAETLRVPVMSKLSWSGMRRHGFCSSVTCRLGVAVSMLLGAVLAFLAALRKIDQRNQQTASRMRQTTNGGGASSSKPASIAVKTVHKIRESSSESFSDASVQVRGKDFTRGVILRSRSNQIIV